MTQSNCECILDLVLPRDGGFDQRLFAQGPNAILTESRMYDVIDAASGDLLGAVDTGAGAAS